MAEQYKPFELHLLFYQDKQGRDRVRVRPGGVPGGGVRLGGHREDRWFIDMAWALWGWSKERFYAGVAATRLLDAIEAGTPLSEIMEQVRDDLHIDPLPKPEEDSDA